MEITTETKQKMISYRASQGFNQQESTELLDEIIERFAPGDNLDFALHYQCFVKGAR